MKPVTYAMQFRGRGTPGESGAVEARSTAPSSRLVTTVGPDGIGFALERAGEGEAVFESEVRFSEGTSFDEWGTITFGAGNRLDFRTIGEGYLAGTQAFNADEHRRRCEACDVVHPPIELEPYRWGQLVDQLRASE